MVALFVNKILFRLSEREPVRELFRSSTALDGEFIVVTLYKLDSFIIGKRYPTRKKLEHAKSPVQDVGSEEADIDDRRWSRPKD